MQSIHCNILYHCVNKLTTKYIQYTLYTVHSLYEIQKLKQLQRTLEKPKAFIRWFSFILFYFVVAWFFLIYLGFFDRIAFISSHFSFDSSLVRLRTFIADGHFFQISRAVRSKHLWEKVDIFYRINSQFVTKYLQRETV